MGTSGMLHAMNPDPYRGAFGDDSAAYAKDLQDLVRSGSSGRLAGFLAETIQGVGGSVPLADGYLSKAYEVLPHYSLLCVCCTCSDAPSPPSGIMLVEHGLLLVLAPGVVELLSYIEQGPICLFVDFSILVFHRKDCAWNWSTYAGLLLQCVREAGGLCIADEVQTGFGRTGGHFWGFERQGVTPDVVTMAKGIGNGLPLAAVVTTPEIASVLTQKLHLNTFGGNPVSCAAGRAVLKVCSTSEIPPFH